MIGFMFLLLLGIGAILCGIGRFNDEHSWRERIFRIGAVFFCLGIGGTLGSALGQMIEII